MWRDESGKALRDYGRPSLAVDVALLTVRWDDDGEPQLCVIVHRREGSFEHGEHALPGTFVREGERLTAAVRRAVQGKLELRTREPRQLRVFDDPRRDTRGHVVTVAHVDLLPERDLSTPGSRWELAPIDGHRAVIGGRRRRLPFDHDKILATAVDWARGRYERRPDPSRLLPEPFTIRELRLLHEAVLGVKLQKDTFRRAMEPQLQGTTEKSSGGPGRRAELFRHR